MSSGPITPRSTQKMDAALRFIGAAAEKGDAQALFILADMHARGQGVPRDAGRAFGFFLRAAHAGDARAQTRVALCFRDGDGVPPDQDEARRWLTQAAAQGDAEARALLERPS